jgi:ferric-dicitrate binding protein FerR (iron transport regulator)
VKQKDNGPLLVALVTGKVRINDQQGNQVNLKPLEMMVMEKGGSLYKTVFDPLEITAWKDKVIVFKSSTFSEVKDKIEDWFGVKIRLKGKINSDWTYSGIYKDETLENVLRGIFLTSGLEYKIEYKDSVVITNPK